MIAAHRAFRAVSAPRRGFSTLLLATQDAGKLEEKNSFTHIVGPSSTWCKDVLPRAAALLDVQPISDVVSVKDESTFVRPMYAGNAMATVKSKDSTKVVTFRPTAFDTAASQSPCAVETVAADDAKLSEFLEVR